MIEDMAVRKFNEKTQSDYIRHVKNLTMFLGRSPDTARARICAGTKCTSAAGGAAADHERFGCGAAVLFHGDVRPTRDGASSHPREATAEAADGFEPG